jgi:oxygen-independent coproporphyrinogen-3 oxidase
MQFLSAYVHIPFCPQRCHYCAFNIYTELASLIPTYLEALGREIRLLGQGETLHSIYIGGGTPSLLSVAQVELILEAMRQAFLLTPHCEITLEVNPTGLDTAYFRNLYALGVRRLSLGMQSAQNADLQLFGRNHTLVDVAQTIEAARAGGFENLSLDLIYGAPHQTLTTWVQTLETALAFRPTHFSIYSLQLESGTRLTQQVKRGLLPPPDEDDVADMYEAACQRLGAAGYGHYEISSFALEGAQSVHNRHYWHNQPYFGFGAGAHGYIDGYRSVNVMRPEKYIQRLNTDQHEAPFSPALQSHERPTPAQEQFETLMLGLRLLQEGLSRKAFMARFRRPLDEIYAAPLQKWLAQGWLVDDGATLRLAPPAYLRMHHLLTDFLPDEGVL